jgi:hypothetical protein
VCISHESLPWSVPCVDREHGHEHGHHEREAHDCDESPDKDGQAAEQLQQGDDPGRERRQRDADLLQQFPEPRRSPTPLRPPVGHEAVSDNQAKRYWCAGTPQTFMAQYEHFDLQRRLRLSRAAAKYAVVGAT